MLKKCKRCNGDISISYILKQKDYDEIICPNCGRKLVVTSMSKMVNISFFIMFFIIFTILPLRIVYIIILNCVWLLFSSYLLPALIYNYEEKN